MGAILLTAFNVIFKYVTGALAVKAVAVTVYASVIYMLFSFVVALLPSWFTSLDFNGLFSVLPDATWYFFNYFQGPFALKMMFSAYCTKFLIRRLPVVG